MAQAHLFIIRAALAAGFSIDVWDGEEWQLKGSTSYKAITDAVNSVEYSLISIFDGATRLGSVHIVPDFGDPDETVTDYSYSSHSPWINDQMQAYYLGSH